MHICINDGHEKPTSKINTDTINGVSNVYYTCLKFCKSTVHMMSVIRNYLKGPRHNFGSKLNFKF